VIIAYENPHYTVAIVGGYRTFLGPYDFRCAMKIGFVNLGSNALIAQHMREVPDLGDEALDIHLTRLLA
jgi:hypothetical protein